MTENILYNELRSRGYHVDAGSVSKRLRNPATGKRTQKQLEIGLAANLGSKRYYILPACAIADEEKLRQEKAALIALRDSFKKIIVVSDFVKPSYDEDGIITAGLFDFLLNPQSLDW